MRPKARRETRVQHVRRHSEDGKGHTATEEGRWDRPQTHEPRCAAFAHARPDTSRADLEHPESGPMYTIDGPAARSTASHDQVSAVRSNLRAPRTVQRMPNPAVQTPNCC